MKKKIFAFLTIALVTLSCSLIVFPSSVTVTPVIAAPPTATPFLPTSWVETVAPPSPTQVPTEVIYPTLSQPLVWPKNLDELFVFIDTGKEGYTFIDCQPGQLQTPWITWSMIKEAAAAELPERRHPYLELYADDVARIIAPGGGSFPNEHRLIRVREDNVFAELFLIEGKAVYYQNQKPILACGDGTGKPIVYGMGIQVFLDWLAAQPLAP